VPWCALVCRVPFFWWFWCLKILFLQRITIHLVSVPDDAREVQLLRDLKDAEVLAKISWQVRMYNTDSAAFRAQTVWSLYIYNYIYIVILPYVWLCNIHIWLYSYIYNYYICIDSFWYFADSELRPRQLYSRTLQPRGASALLVSSGATIAKHVAIHWEIRWETRQGAFCFETATTARASAIAGWIGLDQPARCHVPDALRHRETADDDIWHVLYLLKENPCFARKKTENDQQSVHEIHEAFWSYIFVQQCSDTSFDALLLCWKRSLDR
jgi:hypothetical protein